MNNNSEDRMILVDKPVGISSFGVVAKVRGRLKAEFGRKIKVGHTGTLDPFATGLLILLTGKMTKRSDEFLKLDKEYIATLKLGFISSTGDIEGEIRPYNDLVVSAGSNASGETFVDKGRVEEVIKSFVGKSFQTVPRFSAVKINGRRAYDLARKGVEFEAPTREIMIYEIEILRYEYPELEIRCAVSSGTYIRTLAEDIGKKLGTGAYLTALRRTKVGEYSVEDAVELNDLV